MPQQFSRCPHTRIPGGMYSIVLMAGLMAFATSCLAAQNARERTIYLYLAGPGVFLENAADYGAARKRRIGAISEELGWPVEVVGLYPLDNEIEDFAPNRATGLRIYAANVTQIQRADAVVANMVRFRSPSMDVGTAFEMGFARGMGKPVFAYYDAVPFYGRADYGESAGLEPGRQSGFELPSYAQRVASFYGLREAQPATDPDGLHVEQFGMTDNLMLIGALEDSNTAIAAGFDAAVVNAVRHILAQEGIERAAAKD